MVAVVARPNLTYGLNGYLRTFPDLTALVSSNGGWKQPAKKSGPRISQKLQGGEDGWKMPTRAIVLRRAGGPIIGDDYTMGLWSTRIDTLSYGATGLEAEEVWAMLDAVLVPQTGQRNAAWSMNGVRVSDVVPETDAAMLTDPDTRWEYMFAPYIVRWAMA